MALYSFVLPESGWQVCAHQHIPLNEAVDFSAIESWKWQAMSLPFDAISWLHDQGAIEDPLVGNNDLSCRWVEEVDWVLRCDFAPPTNAFCDEDELLLILSQIDCYGEVFLNGDRIGITKNQFRPHALEIERLKCSGSNELIIYLRSARLVNAVLESAHGVLPAGFDTGRVHSRRTQCLTGWDWTSRLSSVALLAPPEVHSLAGYSISNIFAYTTQILGARAMQPTAESAKVTIVTEIISRRRGSGSVNVRLIDLSSGETVAEQKEDLSLKSKPVAVRTSFEITEAKLWWPLGYGSQALYKCEVTFTAIDMAGNEFICTADDEFGIRTVSLDRQKDGDGEKFSPVINGLPIFCRGSNYLPTTMLPSQATDHDHEVLVCAAAKAGMNCLRVWGGGLYQTDHFYRCCDRLGILVWQDFMFACAAYPVYREFVDEVEKEAVFQVGRLRNHPSLMLWCGNNENEWLHQIGQLKKGNEQHVIGERLWSDLIKTVCEDHDPTRPYHQSSPFGRNRQDLNDESSGDRHHWEAWGAWESPHFYLQDRGRFISEFGFQGMPDINSIGNFAPLATTIESPDLLHHQKMILGQERLSRYVSEMYKMPDTLDGWVRSTQDMQGEVLRRAVEHWRRDRARTSGTLIWQHNDAYPAISWSLIDFYHRPKQAWHRARQFFNPVLLSAGVYVENQEYGAIPLGLWSYPNGVCSTQVAVDCGQPTEKTAPAEVFVSVRIKLVNDTGLDLTGEIRTKIFRGEDEPLLLELVPVHAAPNGESTEIVREFAMYQLQPLPTLKMESEFQPDGSSLEQLLELESMVQRSCEKVDGNVESFPPFSIWEGLRLTRTFVEEKFRLEER